MTIDIEKAKQDLAFIRTIVDEGIGETRTMGIVYFAAGLLYGLQCVLFYIFLSLPKPPAEILWMMVGWLPTIIFLIINFRFVWKDRKAPFGAGAARRAINAAFAGGGMANALLAIIFGIVAYRRGDFSIWLLFPIVVCALQGAIWFAAAIITRRRFMGLTAAGWFIGAASLGFVLNSAANYNLLLGLILFLCMALPGWVLMQQGQTPPSNPKSEAAQ